MEIRISKTFSNSGFIEPGDKMQVLPYQKEIVVSIKFDDGRQTLLDFSQDDIKEIEEFLRIQGWAGHIPFHDWLKKNRPDFFIQDITDRDPDGVVVPLLAKLKEFCEIVD